MRIGPQPYGLIPATAPSRWVAAPGDPAPDFVWPPHWSRAVRLAGRAPGPGGRPGRTTEELLDLIADTPTSSRFRYRRAWPLELWWMGMVGWRSPRRLAAVRRAMAAAATRWSRPRPAPGPPLRRPRPVRHIPLPLVLPPGVAAADFPDYSPGWPTAP